MNELSGHPSPSTPVPDHQPEQATAQLHPVSRQAGLPLGLEYGFVLLREEQIEEHGAAAREYRHLKTGATVFIIHNDDPNAYFGIFFKTACEQSTGVAHIAEHMVYRGSLNFPGTDPVNTYLQESLSSASNAATLEDYTVYYCASPNTVDLHNQATQLLDAVFSPRLSDAAFKQEAWRSEKDSEGNSSLNGIVLNEMRGYASDPLEVHNRAVLAALFPDTHYRFNFAGDPQSIPDLSADSLRTFVREHNHPSNCGVLVYGATDRGATLKLLAEQFDRHTHTEVRTPVPHQPRLTEPVRSTVYYPGAETEDAARDSIVSVSWRLDAGIPADPITLSVLQELILGSGPGSVRAALEAAELGEHIIAEGLEESLKERYFTIAVTGTGASRTVEIEEKILAELSRKVTEGFSSEAIEGSLRVVSGSRLEQNEAADAGESALWSISATWARGEDPLSQLRWKAPLERLRGKLTDHPRYFEELIRVSFLENSHRATLTVRPDRKLTQQWAANDAARAAQLGETPISDEAVDTQTGSIQKLRIADLERHGVQIERHFEDGVWSYPIPRRELCSAALALNISHIRSELLPYIQVFGATFGEFHQQALPGVLGTLRSDFQLAESPTGMQVGRLIFTGFGLGKDGPALLQTLAEQALVDPLQDRRRLIQLMVEQKALFEAEIQEDGAAYCQGRANAKLRNAAAAADMLQGLSAYDNLRALISEAKKSWGAFSEKLTTARSLLLAHADPVWSLSAAPKVLTKLTPRAAELSAHFGRNPGDPAPWSTFSHPPHEGFWVPSQVASTAITFDLRAAGYQHHGSLHVLLKLIEHGRLWPEIRQRNGAYSPRIEYAQDLGLLTICSQFDSRPHETIGVTEQIPEWLQEVAPKIRQLRRGKIGAIGELDKPRSKAERAAEDFLERLRGMPVDFQARDRAQIFEAQGEHCQSLATVLAAARTLPWSVAAIGSRRDLERLNQRRGGEFMTLRPLEPRTTE